MLSDGENEYIYGNDRVPLAQVKITDGTVTYLHTDLNGSVTASTNGAGAIAGTVTYSPYGKYTTAPISKFGYAGDWTDPDTGFTYLRNRWLDTATGTFLSEDPLVQTTGNSFGYTSGNPLTQIDPMGLCDITTFFNIISDCHNWMDSSFGKQSITTFAGYGDGLTFGITKPIREKLLGIHNICTESAEYEWGGYASILVPTGLSFKGGWAFLKSLKNPKKPYYMELDGDTVGETLRNGQILIDSRINNKFYETTLRHEAFHSAFRSHEFGRFLHTTYKHSHLSRFLEEVGAEWYGSKSFKEAIKHPFVNGYKLNTTRIAAEAAGIGAGISLARYWINS